MALLRNLTLKSVTVAQIKKAVASATVFLFSPFCIAQVYLYCYTLFVFNYHNYLFL